MMLVVMGLRTYPKRGGKRVLLWLLLLAAAAATTFSSGKENEFRRVQPTLGENKIKLVGTVLVQYTVIILSKYQIC